MKTIVLSFDDARSDFYTRVFPILKKYNIPATLNVITGFVNGDAGISFPSAAKGMTVDQLVECQQSGLVEIACHGASHINTRNDVEKNIIELKGMGVDVADIGFASPNSVITEHNLYNDGIGDMMAEGKLSYVRSGVQIRREGLVYSALSLMDRFIHSNILFWYLNKQNVISNGQTVIPSVAVYSHTTCDQLKCFINKMPCNSTAVLMFHSILAKNDDGVGKDRYFWNCERFICLCEWIVSNKEIIVSTTRDIVRKKN